MEPEIDLPPLVQIQLLENHLLLLSNSYRFVPSDAELLQLHLTAYIDFINNLNNPNNPENPKIPQNPLDFAPIHVLLGQIVQTPQVLIANHVVDQVHVMGLQLRTGNSTYVITDNFPLLNFPAGQTWRAGKWRNKAVFHQNHQVGSRSDYHLRNVQGQALQWSMPIYRDIKRREFIWLMLMLYCTVCISSWVRG